MSSTQIDPQASILTPAELEAIMQSEESFAVYLASLTVEQIQVLQTTLETMHMEEVQKKAIRRLLDLAHRESMKNEQALMTRALEEKNLLLCLKLSEQLKELEDIQRSLSHDE